MNSKEYLLEFHWMGAYVKVSVIDPTTNIEASIVGDSRTTKQDLEKIAIKKLEYVIKKQIS